MANCHRKCMAFFAPIHHAAYGDVVFQKGVNY